MLISSCQSLQLTSSSKRVPMGGGSVHDAHVKNYAMHDARPSKITMHGARNITWVCHEQPSKHVLHTKM